MKLKIRTRKNTPKPQTAATKKVVVVFDGNCADALNAALCSNTAPKVIGFADAAQARQIAQILRSRWPVQ